MGEGSVQLCVLPDSVSAGTQEYLYAYRYRFATAAGPSTMISDAVFNQVAGTATR